MQTAPPPKRAGQGPPAPRCGPGRTGPPRPRKATGPTASTCSGQPPGGCTAPPGKGPAGPHEPSCRGPASKPASRPTSSKVSAIHRARASCAATATTRTGPSSAPPPGHVLAHVPSNSPPPAAAPTYKLLGLTPAQHRARAASIPSGRRTTGSSQTRPSTESSPKAGGSKSSPLTISNSFQSQEVPSGDHRYRPSTNAR